MAGIVSVVKYASRYLCRILSRLHFCIPFLRSHSALLFFTIYGLGDGNNSPNYQMPEACAFFSSGFNAAAPQNLYGVAPGAGAGPACGTCWQLVGETDSNGNALPNAGTTITVMGKFNNVLQVPRRSK